MAKKTPGSDTTLRRTAVRTVPRDTERAHYLVVIAGDKPGQRMRLGDQGLVIGRSDPADWIINDAQISRSHCRVVLAFDEVIVADLESSNGTFIEGKRITEASLLPISARLQVGAHVFEHEWTTRWEIEEAQAYEHDIEKAGQYIHTLIPKRLTSGPVRTDWVLLPSQRLGGDVFGYRFLDDRYFAIYLIDVAGHGASAAMHAVSVLNILRRGALPVTDFRNPANVLETINVMFEMEHHSGMYLTIWYGVYDVQTRRLVYASAGHHPAYLVPAGREQAIPLNTANPVIGVKRGIQFAKDVIDVAPKSMLYVFSDGVFEVATQQEDVWGLEHFVPLLLRPVVGGKTESQRILDEVRRKAVSDSFEDDFALMVFTLP